MTTRAHSPHLIFEEKEKLLAVYVDRSNQMETGLNAATVSQVPRRKGTGKGFIMRHTHELLASVGEQRQREDKEGVERVSLRNGGRDAEGILD